MGRRRRRRGIVPSYIVENNDGIHINNILDHHLVSPKDVLVSPYHTDQYYERMHDGSFKCVSVQGTIKRANRYRNLKLNLLKEKVRGR